MYLAQSIERATRTEFGVRFPLFNLLVYRVSLDGDGRPVWKLHRKCGTWQVYTNGSHFERLAKRNARKFADKRIPFIQSATPGRRVTLSQAHLLTGHTLREAALDYLREQVEENPDVPTIQNYVKPPKPPKEKPVPEAAPEPTPADRARTKRERAEAKVAEWATRAAHAERKRKEWAKRARYYSRRETQLEVAGAAK